MELIDFNSCPYSDRDGGYGGISGDKDGILFNDEYWILKYPKSTRSLKNADSDLKYTNSPLSEYLGSHIYQILGYDVHETLLGIRNGKMVVACKDFCKNYGDLREARTIKNAANKELSEILELTFTSTSTTHRYISLEMQLLQLEHNRILKNVAGVKERFWDCVVIDSLINNSDRNDGNWGVLYDSESKTYTLAPIYDNGSCFYPKLSDKQLENYLLDENKYKQSYLNLNTLYVYNDSNLTVKKMLNIDNSDLKASILKLTPIVKNSLKEIKDLFDSIPETYNGLEVFANVRKKYYYDSFLTRLNELLEPAYRKLSK